MLDALLDFPQLETVTCRHEGGAGFMAIADARATGRPGLVMVSRGPGAANAAIALHSAQQDAVPLILVVGQVPRRSRHRQAFQEIDYQAMFGTVAKWVFEASEPVQLAEAGLKALRAATAGTPGPVVLVLPEDVQNQPVPKPSWYFSRPAPSLPVAPALEEVRGLLASCQRPLIVAGASFDRPGGRPALQAFAEAWHVPVATSFRRQDLFDNTHDLYTGELGLSCTPAQIAAYQRSDLILALGTRLGDVTSQGFQFPGVPMASQLLVHAHPDHAVIGEHRSAHHGLVCDPVELTRALRPSSPWTPPRGRRSWVWRASAEQRRSQSTCSHGHEGAEFEPLVLALGRHAPRELVLCVDAGAFAIPVYKRFSFKPPQRLLAPQSGAMGFAVPAAVAMQLRQPHAKVVCLVGDGGFMMTGGEMIAAVERRLPILFLVCNNASYGSIRAKQEQAHPGRPNGVHLFNPDFRELAMSFGMKSQRVDMDADLDAVIADALGLQEPTLVEIVAHARPRPTFRQNTEPVDERAALMAG